MPLSGYQDFINSVIGWLLRSLFWLLYNPFAWTYDWVAWIVSLGSWNQWVRTVIPLISDEPILEIGHGPGHLQCLLLISHKNAFGLDLSSSMGKIAYKRLRSAHLTSSLARANAVNLPYPGESFRSVVATFPSEYIADSRSLSEIKRVLKVNGRLVILPFAWITGKRWLERLAAWLFQVTGQSPGLPADGEIPSGIHGQWVSSLVDSAKQLGFFVTFHKVSLRTSCVMIILAEKVSIPEK